MNKPLSDSYSNREIVLPMVIFFLSGYLLFANTFDNAWTYDDSVVIVKNKDIRSFEAFINNSLPGRPLRELTYMLDYALFGLNPVGYHIQQVAWHLFNGVLIFVLLRRLNLSSFVAWASSLFFIVHPVQVEVVANISHRKDSLMLFFSLLSLISYIEGFVPGRKQLRFVFLSALFGVTAYMAKQSAVALPLLFIAYEYAYLEPCRRLLMKKKWFVPASAGITFLGGSLWLFLSGLLRHRYWAIQGVLSKLNYFHGGTEETYIRTVLKGWAFMFSKLLYPLNLAVEYTFSVPVSWSDPLVVVALLVIAVYLISLIGSAGRQSAIFFMLVWIGAFWLPVSNIWPLAYLTADRYLYPVSVGFIVICMVLVDRSLSRMVVIKWAVVLIAIMLMSTLTLRQNQVWQNPVTLWSNAVKVSPDASFALSNLGSAYLEEGRVMEALPYLKRAVKNRYNFTAKSNLLEAYKMLGREKKQPAAGSRESINSE